MSPSRPTCVGQIVEEYRSAQQTLPVGDHHQPPGDVRHRGRRRHDEPRGQEVGHGVAAGPAVDLGVLVHVLLGGAGPAEDKDQRPLLLLPDCATELLLNVMVPGEVALEVSQDLVAVVLDLELAEPVDFFN